MSSTAYNSNDIAVGTVSSAIAKYGCSGHYSTYCDKQSQFYSDISSQEAILSNWQAYQGAMKHAQTLQATPLPSGQVDAQIPGFRALSEFLNVPYEKVRDNFWIGVAFFTETAAQLCFIFLGWNRRRRIGTEQSIPPAKVSRPHKENAVPAMFSGGHIHADGLIHAHQGEVVLNPGATAWMQQKYPGFVDDLNAAFLNRNDRSQIETPFPNRNDGNGGNAAQRHSEENKQSVSGTEKSASGTMEKPSGNAGNGRETSRGSADIECCKAEIRKILLMNPQISKRQIMQKLREKDESGNKKHQGSNNYFLSLIDEVKGEK